MPHKIQVRRGQKSQLPQLDSGEFGLAQDTEELFIGTGTENIQLSKQADLDSVKSDLAEKTNKISSIVSVKDYGAKGDGIADDTQAVLDAIAVITARSDYTNGVYRGGVLYFPFGTYVVSSLIDLPYGCVIKGEGRNSTIIKSKVTTGYTFKTDKGTSMEDLTIDGAESTGGALDITNPVRKSQFNRIDIIEFRGTGTYAMKLDTAYDTVFNSCEVLRCNAVAQFVGTNNNDIAFYSCNFVDIYSLKAFDIEHFDGLSFYTCSWGKVGYNSSTGNYDGTFLQLTSGTHLTVLNNWFEWGYKAIKNIGAVNLSIFNNHFASGVELQGGDNVYLLQNDFYGNGGNILNNGATNVLSVMNVNRQGYSLHLGTGTTSIGTAASVAGSNPSVRVTAGAAISLTNNLDTVLTFDSERYDTDTIHDNATNNSRLTCKTAGIYDIKANVQFAASATGTRGLKILLNGSTVIAWNTQNAASSGSHRMDIATTYKLNANDYIELQAYQSSGGALNVEKNGNNSPEFMMTKIA